MLPYSQLPSSHDSATTVDRPCNGFDSAKQFDVYLQSRDTLEAVVQFALTFPCTSKLQQDSSSTSQVIDNTHCVEILKISDPLFNSEVTKPCSQVEIKKKHQVQSHGKISFTSSNSSSERAAITKKKRIRWTKDLNKQFIECVNCLGGAKKATPKGILKLMNCDGLTISHVKSRLQNYRVTKYIHGCEEGNSEIPSQPTPKLSMQIIEALRQQIDIQKHLSEQLESQRSLQLKIEEQTKQLKEMLNHQKRKIDTFVRDAK